MLNLDGDAFVFAVRMATQDSTTSQAYYSPPWADVTIIGIAGSSGSGKSTLSHAIVSALNLPWVVILSMVVSQLDPSTEM